MYNDDERSSMDSNINTEQSLMNNLSCQDLKVDSYHMVDTESLCSSTSEPHIWIMVLYYSSFVVNIRRVRVAVATDCNIDT